MGTTIENLNLEIKERRIEIERLEKELQNRLVVQNKDGMIFPFQDGQSDSWVNSHLVRGTAMETYESKQIKSFENLVKISIPVSLIFLSVVAAVAYSTPVFMLLGVFELTLLVWQGHQLSVLEKLYNQSLVERPKAEPETTYRGEQLLKASENE